MWKEDLTEMIAENLIANCSFCASFLSTDKVLIITMLIYFASLVHCSLRYVHDRCFLLFFRSMLTLRSASDPCGRVCRYRWYAPMIFLSSRSIFSLCNVLFYSFVSLSLSLSLVYMRVQCVLHCKRSSQNTKPQYFRKVFQNF